MSPMDIVENRVCPICKTQHTNTALCGLAILGRPCDVCGDFGVVLDYAENTLGKPDLVDYVIEARDRAVTL